MFVLFQEMFCFKREEGVCFTLEEPGGGQASGVVFASL